MATNEDAALQQQRELLDELLMEKYEPVAIVGMGVRFPGGNDTPDGFAEFLRAGLSGTGPIPADRWDESYNSADPDARGKVRTAGGGFLDEIDQFDARFFNVSPKEAQFLDPQQRVVLETAWEALENANIDPTTLRHGNGGVYVGMMQADYSLAATGLADDDIDLHIGTGTAHSAVPGRLSYFLGWRGPCISVDTACSSSLVTLHLAVEGLRRRECDIALSGGVNIIHHPHTHIALSQAKMLAPDGRCKTFDDKADGYSRSEGCGMVVLKRLSDAKRDGDRILALVRGVAVRQDGESGGLTVPNGSAQEAVMRAAIASAMLEPRDIQYVEAHGTGTSLGDPIEMGAISAVFASSHSKTEPMVVGLLKTNVGHMEAAAGIGGVVKAVLQLQHRTIYPHLNLETPSRHIPHRAARPARVHRGRAGSGTSASRSTSSPACGHPSATLVGLGKQCVNAAEHLWLTSLHPRDTDAAVIRTALTQLYTAGLPVSWTGYHQGRPGARGEPADVRLRPAPLLAAAVRQQPRRWSGNRCGQRAASAVGHRELDARAARGRDTSVHLLVEP